MSQRKLNSVTQLNSVTEINFQNAVTHLTLDARQFVGIFYMNIVISGVLLDLLLFFYYKVQNNNIFGKTY